MSDTSQGPGWWLASDGKWYPPQPTPTPPASVAAGPSAPTEAVVALVLGIVSILTCGCWGLGIIVGGVGVYLGSITGKKIAASNGALGGAGLAKAGFICSIVGVALGAIGLIFLIITLVAGGGSFYYSVN